MDRRKRTKDAARRGAYRRGGAPAGKLGSPNHSEAGVLLAIALESAAPALVGLVVVVLLSAAAGAVGR